MQRTQGFLAKGWWQMSASHQQSVVTESHCIARGCFKSVVLATFSQDLMVYRSLPSLDRPFQSPLQLSVWQAILQLAAQVGHGLCTTGLIFEHGLSSYFHKHFNAVHLGQPGLTLSPLQPLMDSIFG